MATNANQNDLHSGLGAVAPAGVEAVDPSVKKYLQTAICKTGKHPFTVERYTWWHCGVYKGAVCSKCVEHAQKMKQSEQKELHRQQQLKHNRQTAKEDQERKLALIEAETASEDAKCNRIQAEAAFEAQKHANVMEAKEKDLEIEQAKAQRFDPESVLQELINLRNLQQQNDVEDEDKHEVDSLQFGRQPPIAT